MGALGALHLNVVNVGGKKVHHPICYRDLKPENVMLMEDGVTIKLIDFNTAKVNVEQEYFSTDTICGTPQFMAPAIAKRLKL
jgi:serine/threonine-protein kinase Chk2